MISPPPHKNRNRRYYLHQKIKAAFRYSAHEKTVYVPWDQEEPINQFAAELRDTFGYNIQTEIN